MCAHVSELTTARTSQEPCGDEAAQLSSAGASPRRPDTWRLAVNMQLTVVSDRRHV